MNAMWQLWEERFSKSSCERIVSLANLLPEADAKIKSTDSDEGGVVNKEVRRSKLRWIHGNMPDFNNVYLDIVDMFHALNRTAFGVDLWWLHELQFTQYDADEEGYYDWHNDVLWGSSNLSQRKLSMVIQLSDPESYEGGNFEIQPLFLESPNPTALRKQGSVIVFPSFLKHRVTPVTKGTRYSLVAWMEGPKWR